MSGLFESRRRVHFDGGDVTEGQRSSKGTFRVIPIHAWPTHMCVNSQDKWRNLTAETLPKPVSGPKPLYKDPSVAPVLKVGPTNQIIG